MRKSVFLKHLDKLTREELLKELTQLYDQLGDVKQYYAMELGSDKDRKRRYDKIKKDIRAKYRTKSIKKPRRPRIQKVYSILSEARRTALFDFEMIDIYLFNVEEALNFMIVYNYSSSPLLNIIQKSFIKALALIQSNKMKSEFRERCDMIIRLARIDRDLHEAMHIQFKKYYG